MENYSVIDLFCGAGALTYGFVLEGFNVVAGFDADKSCKYAYKTNNHGALFIEKRIEDVTGAELKQLYPEGHVKILVGCAPCQPYSPYNKGKKDKDKKWELLSDFADLISETEPDIVSMENVPDLVTFQKGKVYQDFVERLEEDYTVTEYPKVFCPDYGVPQSRKRLVLFASKYGKLELLPATCTPDQYKKVKDVISDLEPLKAGKVSQKDPYHKASRLSKLNLRRIKASKPGGTWKDWPAELVAQCHQQESGSSYLSVYGRMKWDELSPTITTQCYGFGNGRFGHPDTKQNRAISLREAARLQTFPDDYKFVPPNDPHYSTVIGRLIGNAVPIELARVIARSIKHHLETYVSESKG
jgi:DNA (cytosine-5)-methyltransferase 1